MNLAAGNKTIYPQATTSDQRVALFLLSLWQKTHSKRRTMAQAAIRVGWLAAPELMVAEVETLPVAEAQWLGQQIAEAYKQAIEIPKN